MKSISRLKMPSFLSEKSIGWSILILLTISTGLATSGTITHFDNESNPFNITFIGNKSYTYYLSIPLYSYIQIADIDTITSPIPMCYQEYFNISENCGGLDNGTLKITGNNIDPQNATDGDYSTKTFPQLGLSGSFKINYTIPKNAIKAIWQIKGEIIKNLTIPQDCFDNATLRLLVSNNNASGTTIPYCYDLVSSTWHSFPQFNTDEFYEEAIFWNLTTPISLKIGDAGNLTEKDDYSEETNNVLRGKCMCSNCSITKTSCKLPYTFSSYTTKNVSVDIKNISYTMTIDSCSNSLGISSNATALNISFYDSETNNLTKVNITAIITGTYNYSEKLYDKSSFRICIYPAWMNVSESISIQSNKGESYNYYSFNTYLNNNTQIIKLYTQENTHTTIFTVKDKDTGELLHNAMTSMYRRIDGNWEAIESKTTDITGRAQFSYEDNTEYKFYFSKTNYADYVFILYPVLFDSYDVLMTKSIVLNKTTSFDKISLTYSPTQFKEGKNNFSLIIQSPFSELKSYGYTLTYPGGTSYNAGTNNKGSELDTYEFNITGSDIWDKLKLDYWYDTQLSGNQSFTFYFAIYNPESNHTMMANKDKTYGMGLFERILIAVSIAVLTVGIASLIGQPIMGMGLSLIIFGWMGVIGLLPWWSIFISLMAGILLLGMGKDY